jgi:hypothetical protein
VVLSSEPATPKDGEDPASIRVYQKVLTFPRLGQATSTQYLRALAVDGTAKFSVGPLTGHPVSVIQTSFPPTALLVLERASLKREAPLSMLLAMVFWKYG